MRAALIAVNLSTGNCVAETFSGTDAISAAWEWKRRVEHDFRDCSFTIVADQEAADARRAQMGDYASYDYNYVGIGTEPK